MKKYQKDHEDPANDDDDIFTERIFHCPGGFQPGKMKADERWRPMETTQKPEQQVCHESHDAEYLDILMIQGQVGSSPNMMMMLMTMIITITNIMMMMTAITMTMAMMNIDNVSDESIMMMMMTKT